TPSARTVAAKAGSFTSSGGHTRSPGTQSPSPAVSTPTTRCGEAASSRSTCPPAASSAATRTRSVLAPLGGGPLDQPGDPVERAEIVDLEAVEGKAHTEARLEREHELDERHGVHETGLQQLGFGRLHGEGQVLDEDRADFVEQLYVRARAASGHAHGAASRSRSARRSTLPFGFSGSRSSRFQRVGSIYGGSSSASRCRSAAGATSAPRCGT